MKPLAIVASHPIQYQGPLYRYLAMEGIPLHVYFLDDLGLRERYDPGFGMALAWDVDLTDGYPHTFLPNRGVTNPESFFGLFNPAVAKVLSRERYSAVLVHGWRSASMFLALAVANANAIPVLYRSDTSGIPDRKARLTAPLFRKLISACLSVGALNRRFYSMLGFPEDRLFTAPHAVDNARFQAVADSLTRAEARDSLCLPRDALIVLFAGKLVPWKQPDLLLKAFAEARHADACLVFVGDGVMKAELEAAAQSMTGRVRFLGFLNQQDIALAYRAADLLVLPSQHEPWGLVVNEAMNFAVPAVVSDKVGCQPDLVTPGVTGDVFDHASAGSLASVLSRLLSAPDLLGSMGVAARNRISGWGYPECATAIRGALRAVGADA